MTCEILYNATRKEQTDDLSEYEDDMEADVGRRRGMRTDSTEDAGRYVMSVAVTMTGVDAHRIRKYEDAGLVKPSRTGGGQRLFTDGDIARIREVARLEREGVNLKGIEVILRMKGKGSGGVEDRSDDRRSSEA